MMRMAERLEGAAQKYLQVASMGLDMIHVRGHHHLIILQTLGTPGFHEQLLSPDPLPVRRLIPGTIGLGVIGLDVRATPSAMNN